LKMVLRLTITEEGRNLPKILGRRNLPSVKSWPVTRRLADLPTVRDLGRTPPLLPQGTILQRQLTKYPIIPILDRSKPLLQWVKTRRPLIPRTKILGAFGVVDPRDVWPPERQIGDIPKPMSVLSGPRHPLHPSKISVEW